MVQIPIAATEAGTAGGWRERREADSKLPQAPAAGVVEIETEIICPLTGQIAGPKDTDGLIDLYERLKEKNDQIYSTLVRIRMALSELTEGAAVTRRVKGKRRQAKVTMPDVSFEQSILKELWNSHPQLAKDYLKISTLSVVMAEYKKLINTASQEKDFVFFRDAMTKAERGRVGTPSVAVEV